MNTRHRLHASLAFLALCANAAWAQEKPEDVRIVAPVVDKAAGKVTVPGGAFWNPKVADWVEVAVSGRPSDFLHETVVSVTTTRTLLENALREIGCHDGDGWVDNVKDFPRVRGDRLLIVVEFTREGKREVYSLDELLSMSRWGVALGPYGFMFKGDPDHASTQRAGAAGGGNSTDATKIMRDDPQVALVFKGLQAQSQTFMDHPLAYDVWVYPQINRGRNHGVLPAEVFDSNGKIPVSVTFQKVTEEQLLAENAKVWHDEAAAKYMLSQVETARQIDKAKEEYWKLHRLRSDNPDGQKRRLSVLLSEMERDYAALDAAWAVWAADHLKLETDVAVDAAGLKQEAGRWREHMLAEKERTMQMAVAVNAQVQQMPGMPEEGLRELRGREIEARSRALLAENKQVREYWLEKQTRMNALTPVPAADDVFAKDVNLHVALVEAGWKMGEAGVAYGAALQKAGEVGAMERAYAVAGLERMRAQARLDLASLEFELKKRQGLGGLGGQDAELAAMLKQRDVLQAQLAEAERLLKQYEAGATTQR